MTGILIVINGCQRAAAATVLHHCCQVDPRTEFGKKQGERSKTNDCCEALAAAKSKKMSN
ncbi:hypothetical protein HNP46_006554 [Pseudomonas nitritireducens]|uniref:Uncharacterized protein n=1 Tax=Pseudomonas nitroreducens TaxID=46680 RepID=A0A7W7P5F2_PSENT|nr:hypothetical protein [Pseudomonas nitritireducens]MBB4867635.1 hypothetical protein [Pseudomonas nitritireducens]